MMKTGELVMDVGTVLDGEDAVNCGLIDELGGLSDALDFLDKIRKSLRNTKNKPVHSDRVNSHCSTRNNKTLFTADSKRNTD